MAEDVRVERVDGDEEHVLLTPLSVAGVAWARKVLNEAEAYPVPRWAIRRLYVRGLVESAKSDGLKVEDRRTR